MAKQVIAYSVVIASPADTTEERRVLPQVLHDWNAANRALGVVLEPLLWETHATPEMGDRPQAIINRQLIDVADMLIAVFWTKFGPGTVEEITRFRKARKPVRLYFSAVPADLAKVDMAQYEQLKRFKERCRTEGLFSDYTSLEELRQQVIRHLTTSIHAFLNAPILAPIPPRPGECKLTLSKEAYDLLATPNPSGTFVIHEPASSLGGKIVIAGEQDFGSPNLPEVGARYIAGLRQLERDRLVERNNNYYELTADGWAAKNRLPMQSPNR